MTQHLERSTFDAGAGRRVQQVLARLVALAWVALVWGSLSIGAYLIVWGGR